MKRRHERHRFLVSFDENSFQHIDLFPEIRRRSRPGRGRKGLSGGKLEILEDGLRWQAGGIATPRAEIAGSFFLPWAAIARVDVTDLPHTVKALGGALTLFLTKDRGRLDGEFLGSRTKLLAALSSTPVGVSTEATEDETVDDAKEGPTLDSTSFGKLSEDGERFWNGTAWVSATSADGEMFWNGNHWSRHA